MAKIDPEFHSDIFKFIHAPIREGDKSTFNFLERFLKGPQTVWEQRIHAKILRLNDLLDPALTEQPRFLKDHVGFTKELDNIISDVTDSDLRKIISLAVALWKKKGLEVGYEDIIRVFTGANVRIFNWFDFRYIVGEQQLGESQLGEDSWFISSPGVLGSEDTENIVVALMPFENTFTDRSPIRNPGIKIGEAVFFNNGATNGSLRYVKFGSAGVQSGLPVVIEIPPSDGYMFIRNSASYDFSGSFTIEVFIRTSITQDIFSVLNDGYVFSKVEGTKEISIQYKTSTNEIIVNLNDGTNSVSFTLASGFDLDDNSFRHIALTINRDTDQARLWFNGTDSTAIEDISTLGDLTNTGEIFVSTKDITTGFLKADYDNFRVALNTVYETADASIIVPINSFIESIAEALDEFFSDVRIQDDGTGSLNRILLKRIINLMRPTSERLNLIFVRLADDFRQGKGNFTTLTGSSTVNSETQMVMQPDTFEIVDIVNADTFQDIYFQASLKIVDVNTTGCVVFNWQDINNYYIFKMTTGSREFGLSKIVAGVEIPLAANVIEDIEENTNYILTVTTFKDPFSSDVKIIAYQDRNTIFETVDTEFASGRFGFKSETGTTMIVDEVEMFEQPLETDLIVPGFSG